MDSLSLENESKRTETNGDSDNFHSSSETTKETETKDVLSNGKPSLNGIPVDNSAESSTDTIVPNGDVKITKVNGEVKR